MNILNIYGNNVSDQFQLKFNNFFGSFPSLEEKLHLKLPNLSINL